MLVVENLHFAYNSAPVLQGLDMEVHEGEMVGVVGPNGSGKTTLLRLISGVLQPSAGRIRVNASALEELPSSQRAKLVSVVPQNPTLPWDSRCSNWC